MKKQLVTILGVAVMAAPAFASKARLQALGEDIYGSTYINDNRNIFLNAAQVNNYADLVTFETGAQTDNDGDDSAAGPRPEGGVFFRLVVGQVFEHREHLFRTPGADGIDVF